MYKGDLVPVIAELQGSEVAWLRFPGGLPGAHTDILVLLLPLPPPHH